MPKSKAKKPTKTVHTFRQVRPRAPKQPPIVSAAEVTHALNAATPSTLRPVAKKDTRLSDIVALHAPDRNVSGEYYCTAGCKGAYPCPTIQIIKRES